jgi:DNA-binding beta-propeller fold protein YncE
MSTRATVLLAALLLGACSSDVRRGPERPDTPPATRVGNTRGGAVVLSRDEKIAVVANRTAGVVSVVALDPGAPADSAVNEVKSLDVDSALGRDPSGPGSEPWAAVIGRDDDTAYVILRADQRVIRVSDLRTDPKIDAFVAVGSEPTALVIAPSGTRLFVANFGEGTISIVTTDKFVEVLPRIDLNEALGNTGFLGDVPPRPALAHPRALALTDDGDENDRETLYATEFYSLPIPGAEDPGDITQPDHNRQGLVYPIPLGSDTQVLAPITIAPVTTGFFDSVNSALPAGQRKATSCVPNQLYAAAVSGDQLFITAMCASPAGPVGAATNADGSANPANFKTIAHPSIFTIDTRTNKVVSDPAAVLTRDLEDLYAADGATERRMPLIPNDIDVAPSPEDPSARRACMTALGADAVFCAWYGPDGTLQGIGDPNARFVDLHSSVGSTYRPIGVALSRTTDAPLALVVNDETQDLSSIDLSAGAVARNVPLTTGVDHAVAAKDTPANRGRTLFATGLNVWSLGGQAWNSCETCHPDGLSDGLTWFFTRGPRRTLSTAGTYTRDDRRVMLWGGNIDEIHDVEVIARSVAGGVGGLLWSYPGLPIPPKETFRIFYQGTAAEMSGLAGQNAKPSTFRRDNLNGSLAELVSSNGACGPKATTCDTAFTHEWNDIDAFIRTVRAPKRPTYLDDVDVARGKALFENAKCNGCHSGPAWTLSKVFYSPGQANNGSLLFNKPVDATEEMAGKLRRTSYTVPPELRPLNPPGASGSGPLRSFSTPTASAPLPSPGQEGLLAALYPDSTLGDQINCVLRNVGTFPAPLPAGGTEPPPLPVGVSAADAPVVREVRQNMKDLAFGGTGFNIPSLLGLGVGAPYLHAGNARTLEELFGRTFASHHHALAPDFAPNEVEKQYLVAYLLSIDDAKLPESLPDDGIAYDLCASAGLK